MKYSCRMEGSQPDNSWKIVFNRKCNSITLSITHEKTVELDKVTEKLFLWHYHHISL